MNCQKILIRNPKICNGELVVKGTRVTIRTILASLAEGASTEEILKDYPSLTKQAIRAISAFAVVSTKEKKTGVYKDIMKKLSHTRMRKHFSRQKLNER